jgi:hypothetical protein
MADRRPLEGKLLHAFTRAKAVRLRERLSLGLPRRPPTQINNFKRDASTYSVLLAKHVPSLVPARSESVLRGQQAIRIAAKLRRTVEKQSFHRQSLSFHQVSPNRSRNAILCSSRNCFPLSFLALKKQSQPHFITLPKVERSEPYVATVNLSCSLPKLPLSFEPCLSVQAKPERKPKTRPFKIPYEPKKEVAEDTFSLSSWKADFSDT